MLPSLTPPPWFMLCDDPFCVFCTGLLTACSPYKDVSPVRGAAALSCRPQRTWYTNFPVAGLLSEEGVLPRALVGPPHQLPRLTPGCYTSAGARPTFPAAQTSQRRQAPRPNEQLQRNEGTADDRSQIYSRSQAAQIPTVQTMRWVLALGVPLGTLQNTILPVGCEGCACLPGKSHHPQQIEDRGQVAPTAVPSRRGLGHRTGLYSLTAPRPDILCMTVWDYIGPNGTT